MAQYSWSYPTDATYQTVSLVDRIGFIIPRENNDHQCIPCTKSGTKRAPIQTPKKHRNANLSSSLTLTCYANYKKGQREGSSFLSYLWKHGNDNGAVYFLNHISDLLNALFRYKNLAKMNYNKRWGVFGWTRLEKVLVGSSTAKSVIIVSRPCSL